MVFWREPGHTALPIAGPTPPADAAHPRQIVTSKDRGPDPTVKVVPF
jgi:hypothetical protein